LFDRIKSNNSAMKERRRMGES